MALFKVDLSRREMRDAARLALQSAVAGAGMFAIMQVAGLPEKFVGILSAVLVVEPSVGSTLGSAWQRFVATVVGSLIGVICLWLLPAEAGTLIALGVSMLVINGVAAIRPEWRYGVVAAVALSLRSESEMMETALDRTIAIGLGVVVGMVVSLVLWPDKAENRARRHLRAALRASARRLEGALRRARGEAAEDESDGRDEYHARINDARAAADAVRIADSDALEERIDRTERVYNSILIINRIGEETDQAFGSDETDLRDEVVKLQELACEVATGLAEGENGQTERLDRMKETLERVRARVAETSAEPEQEVLRNALVFGLDEVEENLRALVKGIEKERSSGE